MKLPKMVKSRRKRIREPEADVKVLEGACRDWERTVEMLMEKNKNETEELRREIKRLKDKNMKAQNLIENALIHLSNHYDGVL